MVSYSNFSFISGNMSLFFCSDVKYPKLVRFLANNQHTHEEKINKKILRGMSIHRKLGIISESKVVQKLRLEKNV